jgi:hypothetical protein
MYEEVTFNPASVDEMYEKVTFNPASVDEMNQLQNCLCRAVYIIPLNFLHKPMPRDADVDLHCNESLDDEEQEEQVPDQEQDDEEYYLLSPPMSDLYCFS